MDKDEHFEYLIETTTKNIDAGTHASYYAFYLHGYNFATKEELENNTLTAKQSEIDKFKNLSINRNKAKSIFTIHSSNEDKYIKVGKRQFDKFIDLIYDSFEEREIFLSTKDVLCDDCKHYLSDNGNFPLEPCGSCTRFYADMFEEKYYEANSN